MLTSHSDSKRRPGLDHIVELPHVVGSTRHDVANTLLAVIGLTLAQQVYVEFVTYVAFDTQCHYLSRIVREELHYASEHTDADNSQGEAKKYAGLGICLRDGIEGIPH